MIRNMVWSSLFCYRVSLLFQNVIYPFIYAWVLLYIVSTRIYIRYILNILFHKGLYSVFLRYFNEFNRSNFLHVHRTSVCSNFNSGFRLFISIKWFDNSVVIERVLNRFRKFSTYNKFCLWSTLVKCILRFSMNLSSTVVSSCMVFTF